MRLLSEKSFQQTFNTSALPYLVDRLVFLDESGINTDMTRLYGRAPSSQRTVDHVPLNTSHTITVLSSFRYNSEKAFTTYLKETLLPTLHTGDIVVMDNMHSHHVKAGQEVLEEEGVIPLYLPPYSPDLNPIEKMWSKVKAILCGWKVRSQDALPAALQCVLSSFSSKTVNFECYYI